MEIASWRKVPVGSEVVIRSAGGGGWGDPLERDPEVVQAGVEVELVNFASATEMLPVLATGQLDAGGTTPVAAGVNAVARGVDVKTVAEYGTTHWLSLPTVGTAAFSAAPANFAPDQGVGPANRIVLALDGAGWHNARCRSRMGSI